MQKKPGKDTGKGMTKPKKSMTKPKKSIDKAEKGEMERWKSRGQNADKVWAKRG
ncbi:MAG: hypothetical protein E6230_12215 [Paenibacillus dendritiformis]|uniref:hypothetical protein n=1 Tax=Paenibacillus dendritiformis TaxID=130049 RepID=UPI001B294884|nr:hypothetical protein [Paenibacillus dendritiformis]MDU5142946.1 hypothetical protein [Paenibacillus dendritiformis]GIO75860.1 hypothetical protein J27TS7_53740 [Paenibacillus dendritiformis]